MKISDVKAHHIRIPYDAGPASFRQGASAIAALDMIVVEVTTDTGLTGWGDAFAYVCPKTTCSAVTANITPPSWTIVVVSPLAMPSSMIVALTVGRYSEARVLTNCSVITVATSRRYGRTYWRSSARSIR